MDTYEVKSGLCLLELDTESPENRVRAWLDGLSGVQKFLDQEAQSDSTFEHTEGCTSGEAAVCDRALIEIDGGNKHRNEQERKANNNSENSSSSSEGYSAVTTYGRPYTEDECEAMILYIMDNEAHSLTGGNMLWKKMQAEKVCERSWQSMRTCFRKKILPNIGQYRLQEKEAKKFSDILQPSPKKVSITMKPGERGWRRNTNFYVKEDDEKILEYLLHRNRFCSVGGVVLWKKMENKNIVPGRSWQSMKSRYLNIILPNVHVYNLNEDCINKLKQKKGYGKVKKKTKKEILESHDKPMNNNNSPSKSFISEEKRQNFRKRAVLTGLSLAEQLRQTKALQLVPHDMRCLPLNQKETVNTASNNKNLSQVHKSHSEISKGQEVSAKKSVSKKKLYACVTKWNGNENEITISSEQESTSLNKLHASSGELAINVDSTTSPLKRKLTTQSVPTKHLCQSDRAQISIGESESENQDKTVAHTLLSSQNPHFALSPKLQLSGNNQLKEISVDLACQVEESEGYATDHEEDVNAERQISETSQNLHVRNVLVPTKSGTDKRDNGGVSSDCGCETYDSSQHCERGSKGSDNGDESIREFQEQQMPSPHSLSSHKTEDNQPVPCKPENISPVLALCSIEPVLKMSEMSSPHLELHHELSQEQCIDQQTKDNTGKQYKDIVNFCDEVSVLDATENACDEHVSHKLSKRLDDGDHYKELEVSHDLDNVKHAEPNDSKLLDGIMLCSPSSLDCDTSPSPRGSVNLNKNKNSEQTDIHTSKIVADRQAIEMLERGIGGSESFDPLDFCENNKRKNTHATFGRQDVSNSCRGSPCIKEVSHACFGPCSCNMQTCDLSEGQEIAFLKAKEGNVYIGDEGFLNVNTISPRIIEKELVTCKGVPQNLDYDLSADLPNNSSQDASRSSCGTLQLCEEDPSGPILENASPNQRILTSFSKQGPIQTSTPRIIFPINEKNLSHKVDPSPSIILESDPVECDVEPSANTVSGGIVDTCDSECPSLLPELTCHERMTESENSLKMCACLENLGHGRVCAVGRHDSSVHSASTEVYSDNGEHVVCSGPDGDFSSDTNDIQYKLISQEALTSEGLDGNSDVGIDSTLQASSGRVQLPQNDCLSNTQEATNEDISDVLSDEDLAQDLVLRIDDSGGESPTHPCHTGKQQPCRGCSRCYGSMSPVSD